MSLTHALSNALSGLTANSRAASVVSSNLANLHTPGYGRREIELSADARGSSGGVKVQSIVRHMDRGVLADRRAADGAMAHAQTGAAFFERLESVVGTPENPGSLGARLAAFDAALATAASRPEAPDRLSAAVTRAAAVATAFNAISQEIQSQRQSAEAQIAGTVDTLNTSLTQVQSLNTQIQDAHLRGFDVSSLEDQRQIIVDRIAEIVPVREVPGDHGRVGLVSTGGAVLLDRVPTEFEFTQANAIVADMTLEGGGLSALRMNGEPVATSGGAAQMKGGRMAALFELRDDHAVSAQSRLDALAQNLVERFQAPGLDTSRAVGEPGLFTDSGASFAPGNETGLAGRLQLNARVDPDAGGDIGKLRDGLGAVSPGAEGDATLLNAMRAAISDRQSIPSAGFSGAGASLAGHAGTFVSSIAQERLTQEQSVSFAGARQGELDALLLKGGVDSDAETQRLLIIEQAFAANARMLEVVDDMMQSLLRI